MKRLLIEIGVAAIFVVAILFLCARCRGLRAEAERGERNTGVLLGEIERYKVRDSLNGARVQGLELKVEEYEKYRQTDGGLIKDLRIRCRDLERVTDVQTETIARLRAEPRDTVIIRDSVEVPAKAVSVRERWYDFDAVWTDGEFCGEMRNRDSIVVIESVKMTRCLFKSLRRVKERSVDVVSKNPNTVIEGVEFVVIEK